MTAITTPPVRLVAGVAAQLVQPQTYILGAVTVANLSPFLIAVQVGSRSTWLQPFTEAMYPLAGSLSAPIGLSPTLPAGTTVTAGTAAQVTATWYEVGQEPPGSWPVSLTAQAVTAAILAGAQVTTVDKPVTLEGGTFVSDPAYNTGTMYDVTGYQSVNITVNAYKTVSAGVPVARTVFITWFTLGVITSTETFSFICSANYLTDFATRYSTSVKGTAVQISFGAISSPGNPITTVYTMSASNRPADIRGAAYFAGSGAWAQFPIGDNTDTDGRDRFSSCAVASFPSGRTLTAYPNTWDGPFQLQALCTAPAAVVNVTVGAYGIGKQRLAAGTLSNLSTTTLSSIAPRRPLYVDVQLASGSLAAGDLSFTLTQ
jgi:hypothetical protein